MKKVLTIILVACSMLSMAQGERERSIEVKGSSEIEITPDEIFVNITLKEYKKGSNKIDINRLEEGLVKAIKRVGIPEDNLRVQNVHGYNWNWRKRKPDDFLANKSFILKVSDLKKMNDIIDMLDPEGLSNMNVQSYSHSRIEEYRKQVKIGAMKAAQEKAAYLLESVGAELGQLLQVNEVEYGNQVPMNMLRSNMAFADAAESSYNSDVEFMKIKVRAEMRVVFEIK